MVKSCMGLRYASYNIVVWATNGTGSIAKGDGITQLIEASNRNQGIAHSRRVQDFRKSELGYIAPIRHINN